ncbi:MAG: hypothetical protein ABH877_00035, partial [bacterium]
LASSPYAMSGVLWDMWRNRRKDREVLVWHAPTALMNPAVPEHFLKAEKRRDPENYRREYEAEFTEAVSAFLPAAAIEACVVEGRTEVEPEANWLYRAGIDAAFKGDRFVLAIGHRNGAGVVVVDHLSGWQGTRQEPVRLGAVIPEIKKQLERYRVGSVYADQYGAEPLRHAFAEAGIGFQEVTFTSQSKADLYSTLRARILDRRLELLDHKDSLRELRGLEVELLPGGAVRIRHGSSGHDDYADAIALAVREAGLRGPLDTHVYAAGRPSIEEDKWI